MAFEQVQVRTVDGQEYGPATIEVIAQWQREGRLPPDAILVDALTGEERPVSAFPRLFIPPPPMPGMPMTTPAGTKPASGVDQLIPTKNPNALAAYYCGIFGLVPCFTLILGPLALILGILGLRAVPRIGVGNGHALAGVILGGLESLALVVLITVLIISAISNS